MNRSDLNRTWKFLRSFFPDAIPSSTTGEDSLSELTLCWKNSIRNLTIQSSDSTSQSFPYGERIALTLEEEALLPIGPWKNVCEDIDSDRFYLEYSRFYERGVRVDRQFLFVPSEKLALIVDSVLSLDDLTLPIRYAGSFAVSDQYRVEQNLPARETAFVPLQKRSLLLPWRLIPLALPEWKKDSSYGDLEVENASSRISFYTSGTGTLCFPLLIDYHSRWNTPKMTWRRLTVGRDFEKVPDSEAVGFRYQREDDQFLFYRSLGEDLLRSVLGEHLRHQTLFARFFPYGKTKRILEVDELT